MKQFEVPIIYRSPLITAIKKKRKEMDKMKKILLLPFLILVHYMYTWPVILDFVTALKTLLKLLSGP